jgi:TetR/AcrR family transcriptional regulator, transcriptional repressor for nem operon
VTADTSDRILDVAERLAQTRGFNGFSYADIAAELGVTKAALHYHFASKSELGRALVDRYTVRFAEALEGIDDEVEDPRAKISSYARLYLAVLRADRMCLCGMLAAEYDTLPTEIQSSLTTFFQDNERWLEKTLARGRDSGTLRLRGEPIDIARLIIGALEGTLLLSRPYSDLSRFEASVSHLVGSLVED